MPSAPLTACRGASSAKVSSSGVPGANPVPTTRSGSGRPPPLWSGPASGPEGGTTWISGVAGTGGTGPGPGPGPGFGPASARSIASSVLWPASWPPTGRTPCACWKARTAAVVSAPQMPSAAPVAKVRGIVPRCPNRSARRVCSRATVSRRGSPVRSCGALWYAASNSAPLSSGALSRSGSPAAVAGSSRPASSWTTARLPAVRCSPSTGCGGVAARAGRCGRPAAGAGGRRPSRPGVAMPAPARCSPSDGRHGE